MANAAQRLSQMAERVLLFPGMVRKRRNGGQRSGQNAAKIGETDTERRLRDCLISRRVWIGEWIFCPARQKSAGILTDGKERLCNDRIERSCTIQFCTAPRWGRCRIYNAVRAENTPPRHARGDFKQALRALFPLSGHKKPEQAIIP